MKGCDCVNRNGRYCKLYREYCGDEDQFGLTCYKRRDVVEEGEK